MVISFCMAALIAGVLLMVCFMGVVLVTEAALITFLLTPFNKLKHFLLRNSSISAKIIVSINSLNKKKERLIETNFEVEKQIEKIKQNFDETLKNAKKEKIIAKEDCYVDGAEIKKDSEYNIDVIVRDVSSMWSEEKERVDVYLCGGNRRLNLRLNRHILDSFNIPLESRYIQRYYSLTKLYKKFENRSSTVFGLVTKIKHKIEKLNADLKYVKTIESLNDIGNLDEEYNIDLDDINAEIVAVEKQLEFNEKIGEI